jgi:hypothetical protein
VFTAGMERSRVRILASRAGLNILPPLPNPVGGTRVSGRTDAWDPRIRSDRRVGPACQGGPAWDPRVRRDSRVRSDRRVGPTCQVGPTCGTHVSGWSDTWDPRIRSDRRVGPACQVGPVWDPRVRRDSRVRSDRRVGPTCQVGLTKFKCMTDGSYTPRKKMSPILHIRKINTWILHIGVNIHVDDTLAKLMRWQSNHFKYILN